MNFQDLQNGLLRRIRQNGVTWGNSPTNTGAGLVPPYWAKLELNQAYNAFLSKTKDYPLAVLVCNVTTVANQNSFSLNSLPNGAGANPSVMQVYEFNYIQATGNQRYIPFVSTQSFRKYTAGYTQILGSYSAFPDVICQIFQQRKLLMFPGTATAGDTIALTVCPDPMATFNKTGTTISCANGGIMVNDADVPLIPDEYHKAIIEGAVISIAAALGKTDLYEKAQQEWDRLIADALDFGSSVAEGDAEQRVIDPWFTTFDASAQVM